MSGNKSELGSLRPIAFSRLHYPEDSTGSQTAFNCDGWKKRVWGEEDGRA